MQHTDLSPPALDLLRAILAETQRVEGLPEFPSAREFSREDCAEFRGQRADLADGRGVSVRRVAFGDGSAAARMARSRLFVRLEQAGLLTRHDGTTRWSAAGGQTTHVALTVEGRRIAEGKR